MTIHSAKWNAELRHTIPERISASSLLSLYLKWIEEQQSPGNSERGQQWQPPPVTRSRADKWLISHRDRGKVSGSTVAEWNAKSSRLLSINTLWPQCRPSLHRYWLCIISSRVSEWNVRFQSSKKIKRVIKCCFLSRQKHFKQNTTVNMFLSNLFWTCCWQYIFSKLIKFYHLDFSVNSVEISQTGTWKQPNKHM